MDNPPMPQKQSVSDVYKTLIRRAKTNSYQVSKAADIAASTLTHIWHGTTTDPQPRIVRSLASVFGVTFAQMSGEEPIPADYEPPPELPRAARRGGNRQGAMATDGIHHTARTPLPIELPREMPRGLPLIASKQRDVYGALTGPSNRHVSRHLQIHIPSVDTYAIRVDGNRYSPRYKEGDFVVCSSTDAPEPGYEVLICEGDQEARFVELLWRNLNEIAVLELVGERSRYILETSTIEIVHSVVAVLPAHTPIR